MFASNTLYVAARTLYLSLIGWPLAGTALAELEYGPVARAQLPDVAGYSSSYLVAGALGLNV